MTWLCLCIVFAYAVSADILQRQTACCWAPWAGDPLTTPQIGPSPPQQLPLANQAPVPLTTRRAAANLNPPTVLPQTATEGYSTPHHWLQPPPQHHSTTTAPCRFPSMPPSPSVSDLSRLPPPPSVPFPTSNCQKQQQHSPCWSVELPFLSLFFLRLFSFSNMLLFPW